MLLTLSVILIPPLRGVACHYHLLQETFYFIT